MWDYHIPDSVSDSWKGKKNEEQLPVGPETVEFSWFWGREQPTQSLLTGFLWDPQNGSVRILGNLFLVVQTFCWGFTCAAFQV